MKNKFNYFIMLSFAIIAYFMSFMICYSFTTNNVTVNVKESAIIKK